MRKSTFLERKWELVELVLTFQGHAGEGHAALRIRLLLLSKIPAELHSWKPLAVVQNNP